MNEQRWKKFWAEFDRLADEIEDKFQKKMVEQYGEGHYYLTPEQDWETQKEIIQILVEKMFK